MPASINMRSPSIKRILQEMKEIRQVMAEQPDTCPFAAEGVHNYKLMLLRTMSSTLQAVYCDAMLCSLLPVLCLIGWNASGTTTLATSQPMCPRLVHLR